MSKFGTSETEAIQFYYQVFKPMKIQSYDGMNPPLNLLREWVSSSPIAAFAVVAATLFFAESFSGWIILERIPLLEYYEPLVEFLLNTGVVMPVLLFLFVLPTARNIEQREATEQALRAMQNELEQKVQERTTDLRHLSARLLTIQEEERRRVARDLHDSLGQKLTGIKFKVEAVLGAPWPDERRSGTERLRSLIPTIQDAVEEVRSISTALRPSVLDDLGLLPTFAWYLREFMKTHPRLQIEQYITAQESDIPTALRTPIFRILQEATNNLAKHSNAEQVEIELKVENDQLTLCIQDDGVGFEPGGIGEEEKWGSGLGSMRERAELSGGTFDLTSTPGSGTRIQAVWRLDPPINL